MPATVWKSPEDPRPNGDCLECFKPVRQPYGWHMEGCTCSRFCETLYKERKEAKCLTTLIRR